MKAITSLNAIKAHEPCKHGWRKLLKYLNKIKADDEVLELSRILESNGLDDALWCLRAVNGINLEVLLKNYDKAYFNTHLNAMVAGDKARSAISRRMINCTASEVDKARYDTYWEAYHANYERCFEDEKWKIIKMFC